MAHLIDMSNGRANMAYVGERPWHGLGSELTEGASLDVWAKEAGLNFTIESSSVAFRHTAGKDGVSIVPNQRVLWRSDTKQPLSIMSKNRYNIVQPNEILEFYRDLVDASGAFVLETAGCLDDGKKIWAMARHKNVINISGDIIRPYLMVVTACDGTMSTNGLFTSVRPVCDNTVRMALSAGSSTGVKIPHSRKFDHNAVKAELGLIDNLMETFASDVEKLASKQVTREVAADIFTELYARRDADGEVLNQKWLTKIVAECVQLFEHGPGAELVTAKNTAWGVINAVTRYEDFGRKAQSNDSRFRSAQFGDGASKKQQVIEMVTALA